MATNKTLKASAISGVLNDPELLRAVAQKLATDGTHGDTILAHIGPREAALLKARGGAGTINSRSGLPQFYDTGSGSDADQGKDMGSSGGAAGSAAGGQGGLGGNDGMGGSGGYGGGPASGGFSRDPSIGSMVGPSGFATHNAYDDAAVNQMNPTNNVGRMSGVNAASSAMRGDDPGFMDKVKDFAGLSNPGGFMGSDLAYGAAGALGGFFGGPAGSAIAKGGLAVANGETPQGVAHSALGATLGGAVNSMMENGVSGPAGNQVDQNGNASSSLQVLSASPLDASPLAVLPAQSPTFAPMGRVQ